MFFLRSVALLCCFWNVVLLGSGFSRLDSDVLRVTHPDYDILGDGKNVPCSAELNDHRCGFSDMKEVRGETNVMYLVKMPVYKDEQTWTPVEGELTYVSDRECTNIARNIRNYALTKDLYSSRGYYIRVGTRVKIVDKFSKIAIDTQVRKRAMERANSITIARDDDPLWKCQKTK